MLKLNDTKVAILVANGFCQKDYTETQRILREAGAHVRIISPESGLVSGWEGEGWGHHFAVDSSLSSSLGADYDVLVIPGGQRSLDKLKLTAHTKRFVSSFMQSGKPVVVCDDALHLMIITDNIKSRTVNGPESMSDVVMQAGGLWGDSTPCTDGNLFTGVVNEENRQSFLKEALSFLVSCQAAKKEAA